MRKRGNNRRQPRTVGPKQECITFNMNDPDGEASYFTPKKPPPRKGIKRVNGRFIRYEKERGL